MYGIVNGKINCRVNKYEVIRGLWKGIAVPTIMYGTEIIGIGKKELCPTVFCSVNEQRLQGTLHLVALFVTRSLPVVFPLLTSSSLILTTHCDLVPVLPGQACSIVWTRPQGQKLFRSSLKGILIAPLLQGQCKIEWEQLNMQIVGMRHRMVKME